MRRMVIGLLGAAALCLGAFGATSASAATLHECTEVQETSTAARFNNPECTEAAAEGFFATTPISGTQNVKATNTGNFTWTAVIAGVHVVITCTGMEAHGTATNEEVEGSMRISGSETSPTFTGCVILEEPGLEGCTVPSTLAMNAVAFHSEGDSIKYTPAEGTVFIEFPFSGCNNALLNGNKKLKGSLKSETTTPTTQSFTETSGSAMTFAGQSMKFLGNYHFVTTEDETPLYLESP
jgi:hypothetical protein